MLLKLHDDRIQFISNFIYDRRNLIVHCVPSKNQNPELFVSQNFKFSIEMRTIDTMPVENPIFGP